MKKIILMDFFNTIAYRKDTPNNILYKWIKKLSYEFSIEPTVLFKWYKKEVLKLSIRKKFKTGESEYKLEELIEILANKVKHYDSKLNINNFVSKGIQLYIDTEKENMYLNPNIQTILQTNAQDKNKIYVLSDFYIGKYAFEIWLEELGIKNYFEDIFVSCEFSKSKRTGALYKEILKKFSKEKAYLIMYGDNYHSDITNARFHKIKANHLKPNKGYLKHIKGLWDTARQQGGGENSTHLNELFRTFKDTYNISNYAFPLYVFTKRLATNLVNNNIKNIFFCSREGQFLKKLFDHYCLENNINIKSHYFLVSRNSILSASLKPLNQEKFKSVIHETATMSIYRFLKTLNFTKDEIVELQNSCESDFNKNKSHFSKSKEFKEIVANAKFIKLYDEKRKQQKKNFQTYLTSFNYNYKANGFHLVDIGWKGTMQNLLNNFFDNKVNLYGYYLGCTNEMNEHSMHKTGILYSNKNRHLFGNHAFNFKLHDYEQICRANHNRVAEYQVKNGKPYIVYAKENDEEQVFKNIINPLQEQIFAKFQQILKYDFKTCSLIEQQCLKQFIKMIKNYSANDLHWLQSAEDNHYDNFARIGYDIQSYQHWLRKSYNQIARFYHMVKWAFYIPKKISYK